ncbi:PQQ-binding-like beta-propeller repeat protein [Pedosphaera parvula]|uniref:Pyrrolo-quinoline quinone n=1 Tax=Pedosphaera parvula (strain Ellin514) TaxID=320771 RepID=B9XLU5_PEDPL|nr:PQQ-binding-like beta-propeller repeat protein [Pedosphaera parvula]EEF59202.1 Pyrrolo-quinoline quinone [Pedosphaera parvula Ellin514]
MKVKLSVFICAFFTALSLFAQQPTQLWVFNAALTASPAVAPDGTIYCPSNDSLFALTPAGSNKWTFTTAAHDDMYGTPAVGLDGTVYFGDYSGAVYALNPDGSSKWIHPPLGRSRSSPALALDGTVYFVADAELFALTSYGTVKWHTPIDASIYSGWSPIIGDDGTIYVNSALGALYAINPDGTVKWQSPVSESAGDSPAIGQDGTIYVTGDALYAINPDGTSRWTNNSPGGFGATSLAIGKDGTLYVGSDIDWGLSAIKTNGELLWRVAATYSDIYTRPGTTPAVDSSGMIYYVRSGWGIYDPSVLYAIDPHGTVQWSITNASSYTIASVAIGPDGAIYAPIGNSLYAIQGTNPLGNTPWPMYRQNFRHTGKLEKPALQQFKRRIDSNFEFQLLGEVGQSYAIQYSSDLANWSSLTNLVLTNLPTTIVDLTATNAPSRYYRAQLQ